MDQPAWDNLFKTNSGGNDTLAGGFIAALTASLFGADFITSLGVGFATALASALQNTQGADGNSILFDEDKGVFKNIFDLTPQ